MTALHQVVLLTLFTSFACVLCTEAEEPWVMVKEMGPVGYQIKSVNKKYDRDLDETTFVSLIQAPIPTTTVNGEDLKLVSTQEDGLSAVYEITTVTSSFAIDPDFLLTSKTESLHVELNILAADGFDEQTDFAFNDFQLQVEKKDNVESTMYKMTIRDCFCLCDFSTIIGKNTTSGFEEMRDYQLHEPCQSSLDDCDYRQDDDDDDDDDVGD
uniref:Uncharacterized protein LOC111103524 n=1 Tax=Crassostrea virginica TaxID=6565 RepID=A0A8B8AQW4_CRAVI|nr:uncharacterized protein LOC111103524 [Crassostrea virginica]